MSIKVGDKVPKFSIKDYDGAELNNNDLIGETFVIYFYPKDDTPGCTAEACSFRDNLEIFDNLETTIIGVSPDTSESHHKFMQKHELNFVLLCDEDLELARKFGAIKEKEVNGIKVEGILRSTYIIDPMSIVRWIEQPVNVEGHCERVVEAIEQLDL